MIKIGVLGTGHLGSIHLKLLQQIPDFQLIGFFDPDPEKAEKAEQEFKTQRFNSIDELISASEAVDIVTPTLSHFECAEKALRNSKHVFIEKPVTYTLAEAKALVELTHEANVKVQVGHVERFNPAFVAATPFFDQPMFIETHRLAQFNPRGTDVSVVLDLMIHDIDIILSIVKSNIRRISASGVAVISDTPDITNARIEFDNGCVANLTASRISMKNMRKSRFFQKNAYIAVDFLNKKTEIIRIKKLSETPDPLAIIIEGGNKKPAKQLYFESPDIQETNAIQEELRSFAAAIINNTPPLVRIDEGYHAISVASSILEKLKLTSTILED